MPVRERTCSFVPHAVGGMMRIQHWSSSYAGVRVLSPMSPSSLHHLRQIECFFPSSKWTILVENDHQASSFWYTRPQLVVTYALVLPLLSPPTPLYYPTSSIRSSYTRRGALWPCPSSSHHRRPAPCAEASANLRWHGSRRHPRRVRQVAAHQRQQCHWWRCRSREGSGRGVGHSVTRC